MRVKVLGCSGGVAAGQHTTALMIDDDILIDAGTGVSLLRIEEMAKVRHVFLTHSHLDHIAAMPLMLDSLFARLDAPLTVHGRPETLRALQEHIFNWVIWPDFSQLPRDNQPLMRYAEMTPGASVRVGARTVEMLAVNHVVPACGYCVADERAAFAFSGDTSSNSTFWEALNRQARLDLLIVEVAFPNRDIELARRAGHYCPRLVADDMAKLRHDPRVFVTHLKPGLEETILAECQREVGGIKFERLYGGEIFDL